MRTASRFLLLAVSLASIAAACDDSGTSNEPTDVNQPSDSREPADWKELQGQDDTTPQLDLSELQNQGDTTPETDTSAPGDTAPEDVWGRWFRVDSVTAGIMNSLSDMTPWDTDGTLADVQVILSAGFPPTPPEVATSDVQNDCEYFNWAPPEMTLKFGPDEILRIELHDIDGDSDDLIAVFDLSGDALQQVLRDRQGTWTNPNPNLFSLGITLTEL